MTARYWLVLMSIMLVLVFTGCLSNNASQPVPVADKSADTTAPRAEAVPATEPPMMLDESKVSGGRSVTPIPSPDSDTAILCRVEYANGLESQMTIDVETHAPLKEVFPQWVVTYDYQGNEDKEARVPASFTVNKNNAGTPGELVVQYQKESVEGQGISYDASGKKKVVARVYFNVDLGLTLKEPPFGVAPTNEGTIRSASPLAPPNKLEEYRTFRVRYIAYGFESRMVTEVATGAPVREVFPFWWQVTYLYATPEDRENRIPTSIIIYRNLGFDTKGAEINRYQKMFVDPDGLIVFYKSVSGEEKEIAKSYFDVAPEPPPETTQ